MLLYFLAGSATYLYFFFRMQWSGRHCKSPQGDTCYLNSVLQFLFTIKHLRDMVLDFDSHKEQTTPFFRICSLNAESIVQTFTRMFSNGKMKVLAQVNEHRVPRSIDIEFLEYGRRVPTAYGHRVPQNMDIEVPGVWTPSSSTLTHRGVRLECFLHWREPEPER